MGHYASEMGHGRPKIEPNGYDLRDMIKALQRRVAALERAQKPRRKRAADRENSAHG